jgi:Icc-related predicted phosphoesterase
VTIALALGSLQLQLPATMGVPVVSMARNTGRSTVRARAINIAYQEFVVLQSHCHGSTYTPCIHNSGKTGVIRPAHLLQGSLAILNSSIKLDELWQQQGCL